MIQDVIYDEIDVEKFLEINKRENEKDVDNATLKKLLSVQNKISILTGIHPDDLKEITYNLKFVKVNYKDTVVKEGDITQEIFYIINGDYQVFVNNKKVGELTTGETFGESAAIFSKKRNAQVVCTSESSVLLSFCVDHNNMDFCAEGLATLYKNLALAISLKLEEMNKHTA